MSRRTSTRSKARMVWRLALLASAALLVVSATRLAGTVLALKDSFPISATPAAQVDVRTESRGESVRHAQLGRNFETDPRLLVGLDDPSFAEPSFDEHYDDMPEKVFSGFGSDDAGAQREAAAAMAEMLTEFADRFD